MIVTSGQLLASHPDYSHGSLRQFAVDSLLRQHGWEIAARCSGQEPVWEHKVGLTGRMTLPQSEVIKTVDWQRLKDALLLEELTGEGLE